MNTTLYLDETFLRQVSARLEKFKQTSPHRFNARCPICGDSKRSRSKARWHAFQHETKGFLVCKCFNCGYTNSFDNFLKEIDPEVHKMYLMEKFKGSNTTTNDTKDYSLLTSKPKFDTTPLKKLKKISQLDNQHPVKQWVNKRQIPSKQHYRLYYAPQFKKWVNTVLPNKFESLENDEPRLVIPMFDYHGKMFGFQGRSFHNKTDLRYITILLDDSYGKLYGLDQVDTTRTVYCVEGPIDSLFVDNCIASAGGDIISDLELLDCNKSNIVVVYDNEPRNTDTIAKIEKAIDSGYNVIIWPNDISEKDINDMVISGVDVQYILRRNIFQGLPAKLRMIEWKKI